ncbi:MAG: uroporphyrinogen-III C-methyltransferase [Desulfovibrionaceae bacterium]
MSKVYLIGAGPGDPKLITVRGLECIREADVVVYDYLANPELLKHARADAERLYVGKKGGDHTLSQDKINELIILKAREGKSVARLKGGDPYIFGRGGEEAEELVAAGVPFEIVPGVTSGAAGPAYAGIPVTHRDHTTSVAFITGHEDPTKEASGHNWEVYAKSTSTLVFYMGVKNLPMIAENLINNGRDPETPAAIIRWGTTCRQRSLVSTLAKLPAEAERLGYTAPSIIVVGGVCCLASKLGWFEKRPLLGKGVVVTRAREQASDMVRLLSDLGACVYEFPTIQVVPLDDESPLEQAVLALADYDWLIFTSVNGVKYFWAKLGEVGLDTRILGGMSVAAIGPATAEALRERGVRADFIPPKYVAEEVVAGLLEKGVAGKRVMIPRALEAREVLPEKLREAGAAVDVVPAYETTLAHEDPASILEALREGAIHCVTFTSSSTVRNFFQLVPQAELERARDNVRLACIGPITSKTLASYGFTPDIEPEDYTVPALSQAVANALSNA